MINKLTIEQRDCLIEQIEEYKRKMIDIFDYDGRYNADLEIVLFLDILQVLSQYTEVNNE